MLADACQQCQVQQEGLLDWSASAERVVVILPDGRKVKFAVGPLPLAPSPTRGEGEEGKPAGQPVVADASRLTADASRLTADASRLTADASRLTADASRLTADTTEIPIKEAVESLRRVAEKRDPEKQKRVKK
jgi:hypothetical protein